jgi:hypothetical protein
LYPRSIPAAAEREKLCRPKVVSIAYAIATEISKTLQLLQGETRVRKMFECLRHVHIPQKAKESYDSVDTQDALSPGFLSLVDMKFLA